MLIHANCGWNPKRQKVARSYTTSRFMFRRSLLWLLRAWGQHSCQAIKIKSGTWDELEVHSPCAHVLVPDLESRNRTWTFSYPPNIHISHSRGKKVL